jgi:CBS domain-containing protein
MKVKQISDRKPRHDVASTDENATLSNVSAKLGAMRIGCLMVMGEDGGIRGIISERDIVRALGEVGGDCLDRPVSSVMTTQVETCGPDDSADSVLERMTNGRFRHMPVVDGGNLVSIISIGDVVKARIEALEQDNQAMEEMIRSATA